MFACLQSFTWNDKLNVNDSKYMCGMLTYTC